MHASLVPAEPMPGMDVEDAADSLALVSSTEAADKVGRYPDKLVEEICGLDFVITPLSFFQTNPAQTEKLYKVVSDAAGDAPQAHATLSGLHFSAANWLQCRLP